VGSMNRTQNITGISKTIFILRLKMVVFFHYLPELLAGRISLTKFVIALRRLLYFMAKMKHNKFVKIGANTRIDLYCPGFPSTAFFTACNKFFRFGEKLPCTTVLISITSACRFRCRHCYQRHDLGPDLDLDVLIKTVQKLQEMGIAFFNIEGGEPFLKYERLKRICEAIDNRAEIWINSTGDGITAERLNELKKLNLTAIMFSMHNVEPAALNRFMRRDDAWDTMEKAIALCHQAGIGVALNCCLPKAAFYNGEFERVMAQAKKFQTVLIQLIKPKPAGGWLESGVEPFTDSNLQHITNRVNQYNLERQYQDFPVISAQIIEESPAVFGCTAGGTDRFYINAKGDLQPCEFLNISFGKIDDHNFDECYQKMRKCFEVPGECWLCEKYSGEIFTLFKENLLNSLPLTPELSNRIYDHWDRGNTTKLYQTLERE
jgi:MoaA/NifB/PqqE/SkfB family radical SAM enzyme